MRWVWAGVGRGGGHQVTAKCPNLPEEVEEGGEYPEGLGLLANCRGLKVRSKQEKGLKALTETKMVLNL